MPHMEISPRTVLPSYGTGDAPDARAGLSETNRLELREGGDHRPRSGGSRPIREGRDHVRLVSSSEPSERAGGELVGLAWLAGRPPVSTGTRLA